MLKTGIILILAFFTQLVYGANMIKLQTNSFTKDSPFPVVYTCDGKDVSPQLSWTGTPEKTESIVLIMSDPDAPGGTFYHWVLYNIPKDATNLEEATSRLPAGTVEGKTSWGQTGYKGPCPPKGNSHRYIFTLYALDTKLNLPANADVPSVLNAMKGHILEQVELTSSYSR